MEIVKKINLITGKILHLDILDNKFIRVISNNLLLNKLALILIFIVISISGCQIDESMDNIYPSRITIKDNKFVDDLGRQVILNGINIVSKSKQEEYLIQAGPEFYCKLKAWGVNCIRFVIIWDGLEPEPGVYNEKYLSEIDKRIKWAEDNGIFVVLDMHQDLFSVKYSDGAPDWATLDEGRSHITGDIWSDAYLLSEAVQTSFDNFWSNKPAPDGIGIQDHYAQLWKYIADRYKNNSTVIGYDIMNEPFPGSSAVKTMEALLNAYGSLVYTISGKILSEEEVSSTWVNSETRLKALKLLSTKKNYSQVIDVIHEDNKKFETEMLQKMYEKVGSAIREVDNNHILFLEHGYFSNMGVKSSIERPKYINGTIDSLVAYAPHGYDLVTDTKDIALAQPERVQFIFDRIKEKGDELGMPIWLGEWGAYHGNEEGIVSVAQYAISLIEKNLFSNAYWSYYLDLENHKYSQKALLRPYPYCVNGELINYYYDYSARKLIVEWKESQDNDSPTIVYVPLLSNVNSEIISDQTSVTTEKIKNSNSGYIIIQPVNLNKNREITIQFENL
jgi:endoglycosylceramidase